jgi:hypothetical protein
MCYMMLSDVIEMVYDCNSATKKLIFLFMSRRNMIEMEVELPSFLTVTLSEGWRQP